MFGKLVLRPLETVQCSTSLELDTPKEPITQYERKNQPNEPRHEISIKVEF